MHTLGLLNADSPRAAEEVGAESQNMPSRFPFPLEYSFCKKGGLNMLIIHSVTKKDNKNQIEK